MRADLTSFLLIVGAFGSVTGAVAQRHPRLTSGGSLRVTTVLTQPFAQYISLTALPHELEGYMIDVLNELWSNVDVTQVPDGQYGNLVSGHWTGMIGQLVNNAADVAAAPLTKNRLRQHVVTFLEPPFMTFGLSILMKKGATPPTISNIEELGDQRQINYGVVSGGSTAMFFRTSDHYAAMWSRMESQPDVSLLPSVEEGVRRVRESTGNQSFAFIGEQPMVEYHAGREPCDLVAVPGDAQGFVGEYHLAARRGLDAATQNQLAQALGRLKDAGRLQALYDQWWVAQCTQTPP